MRNMGLFAIFVFSVTRVLAQPSDSFDFGSPSPAYDIPENIPLKVQVTQQIALVLKDVALGHRFQMEFDQLKESISKAIDGKHLGSLFFIQVFSNEGGNFEIPGGQLLVARGIGINPVDSLAEYMSHDNVQIVPPQGLKSDCSYVWVTSENGHLKVAQIPPEWREKFENMASSERDRRILLAEWFKSAPEGLRVLQRSAYWQDVAKSRLASIASSQERQTIDGLIQKFDTAEAAFNQAYVQYQQTANELARRQQFLQTLQILGVFASITDEAIKGSGLSSQNGTSVDSRANPPDTNEGKIQIATELIMETKGQYLKQRTQIEMKAHQLEGLDNAILEQFRQGGITLQPSEPIVIPEP